MVEARNFVIYTDHKPLTFAFSSRRDNCSPRQFRYLDYISQFTTDIRFVSGPENVVADAMSRVEAITEPLDYKALALAQEQDPELQKLMNSSTSLKIKKIKTDDCEIYCDVSTSSPRPLLTRSFRRQAFNHLHNLSHPGARATIKLLTERFVWPGIKKDCRQWSNECIDCQRTKIHRHTSSPTHPFSNPSSRFSHVHMDIVGPLPLSLGYRYCLTVIDRFTRWPEAYPLADITAETCSRAFIAGWVSRFGCPETITTDRGRQFESAMFHSISTLLGSKHRPTVAYHPACNGMIERLHRQLKSAIMCHADARWSEVLPFVLLGIRSSWKEDIKSSAAELVYGEPLRLPGEFFAPSKDHTMDITDFTSRLRNHISKLAPVPAKWHVSKAKTFYIPRDLMTADQVFLRVGPGKRSLEPPYSGPYKVITRGEKTFTINLQGRECTVSIDRLKPAYLASDETKSGNTLVNQQTTGDAKKTRSGRVVRFPNYYRP